MIFEKMIIRDKNWQHLLRLTTSDSFHQKLSWITGNQKSKMKFTKFQSALTWSKQTEVEPNSIHKPIKY